MSGSEIINDFFSWTEADIWKKYSSSRGGGGVLLRLLDNFFSSKKNRISVNVDLRFNEIHVNEYQKFGKHFFLNVVAKSEFFKEFVTLIMIN